MTRRRWDVAAAHSAVGDERAAELGHSASGRPPPLTSEHTETSPLFSLLSLRETGSAAASSLLLAVSAAAGVCGREQQGALLAQSSEARRGRQLDPQKPTKKIRQT